MNAKTTISNYIYNLPLEDTVDLHNKWLDYTGGLAYRRIFTRAEFVDHITDMLNGGSGMSAHDIVDMLVNDGFFVQEEKYVAYYNDDPVTVGEENISDFVDCDAIAEYCLSSGHDLGDPQILAMIDQSRNNERESAWQYQKRCHREDVAIYLADMDRIRAYGYGTIDPAHLTKADIDSIIDAATPLFEKYLLHNTNYWDAYWQSAEDAINEAANVVLNRKEEK